METGGALLVNAPVMSRQQAWSLFQILLLVALSGGCKREAAPSTPSTGGPLTMAPDEVPVRDPHSFSNPEAVRVDRVDLKLRLDFAGRRVVGSARLSFERLDKQAKTLILDSDGLQIEAVRGSDGKPRQHQLGEAVPIFGAPLKVQLADADTWVEVAYASGAGAKALQWLAKEQTHDKSHAYLFSQGQAILTRSWIPLQDTPRTRIRYSAEITCTEVPEVLMSAPKREKLGDGRFRFAMEQPIPCYLIAIAAGNIARKDLSERVAVFAERGQLEAAAAEFRDTPQMLQQCEQRYGPYVWGRYDLLVLPPAFPFGGMENPTLTFVTPTIITGDRSLVALIAHELAHSWSGNLVTNATWRDFWLNEGFTVYLEQRIMELIFGRERYLQEVRNSVAEIEAALQDLPEKDQILHIELQGRNPDDAMTAIAYDKGAAFLRRLEQVYGRETFDAFLKAYFKAHEFRTITTEQFLHFLGEELLDKHPEHKGEVDVKTWVFRPGLPETLEVIEPAGFATARKMATQLDSDKAIREARPGQWTTLQWLAFLRALPRPLPEATAQRLDRTFGLASHPNPEIRCSFLTLALQGGVLLFAEQTREFLSSLGRRKFIMPLIRAALDTEQGRERVEEWISHNHNMERWHAITRRSIELELEKPR